MTLLFVLLGLASAFPQRSLFNFLSTSPEIQRITQDQDGPVIFKIENPSSLTNSIHSRNVAIRNNIPNNLRLINLQSHNNNIEANLIEESESQNQRINGVEGRLHRLENPAMQSFSVKVPATQPIGVSGGFGAGFTLQHSNIQDNRSQQTVSANLREAINTRQLLEDRILSLLNGANRVSSSASGNVGVVARTAAGVEDKNVAVSENESKTESFKSNTFTSSSQVINSQKDVQTDIEEISAGHSGNIILGAKELNIQTQNSENGGSTLSLSNNAPNSQIVVSDKVPDELRNENVLKQMVALVNALQSKSESSSQSESSTSNRPKVIVLNVGKSTAGGVQQQDAQQSTIETHKTSNTISSQSQSAIVESGNTDEGVEIVLFRPDSPPIQVKPSSSNVASQSPTTSNAIEERIDVTSTVEAFPQVFFHSKTVESNSGANAGVIEGSSDAFNSSFIQTSTDSDNSHFIQISSGADNSDFIQTNTDAENTGRIQISTDIQNSGFENPSVDIENSGLVQTSADTGNSDFIQVSVDTDNTDFVQVSADKDNSGFVQVSADTDSSGFAQTSTLFANTNFNQASKTADNSGVIEISTATTRPKTVSVLLENINQPSTISVPQEIDQSANEIETSNSNLQQNSEKTSGTLELGKIRPISVTGSSATSQGNEESHGENWESEGKSLSASAELQSVSSNQDSTKEDGHNWESHQQYSVSWNRINCIHT